MPLSKLPLDFSFQAALFRGGFFVEALLWAVRFGTGND
jgi:hypothetical protein